MLGSKLGNSFILLTVNYSVEGKQQHVKCRDRKQGIVLNDSGRVCVYIIVKYS